LKAFDLWPGFGDDLEEKQEEQQEEKKGDPTNVWSEWWEQAMADRDHVLLTSLLENLIQRDREEEFLEYVGRCEQVLEHGEWNLLRCQTLLMWDKVLVSDPKIKRYRLIPA
jgi:hypothetical protein